MKSSGQGLASSERADVFGVRHPVLMLLELSHAYTYYACGER